MFREQRALRIVLLSALRLFPILLTAHCSLFNLVHGRSIQLPLLPGYADDHQLERLAVGAAQ